MNVLKCQNFQNRLAIGLLSLTSRFTVSDAKSKLLKNHNPNLYLYAEIPDGQRVIYLL